MKEIKKSQEKLKLSDQEATYLISCVIEERNQRRHSETQRSTLTNLIVLVCSALIAIVSYQKFEHDMVGICILIVVLGIYGVLSSAKYYERSTLHRDSARAYEEHLSSLLPLARMIELKDGATEKHNQKWSWLSQIHQYWLWLFLHLCIVFIGAILIYLTLKK